jgi:hypothetical protein
LQGGIRKSIASEIVENGTRKHYIANNPLLLTRNSSPISQKKKKKKENPQPNFKGILTCWLAER